MLVVALVHRSHGLTEWRAAGLWERRAHEGQGELVHAPQAGPRTLGGRLGAGRPARKLEGNFPLGEVLVGDGELIARGYDLSHTYSACEKSDIFTRANCPPACPGRSVPQCLLANKHHNGIVDVEPC